MRIRVKFFCDGMTWPYFSFFVTARFFSSGWWNRSFWIKQEKRRNIDLFCVGLFVLFRLLLVLMLLSAAGALHCTSFFSVEIYMNTFFYGMPLGLIALANIYGKFGLHCWVEMPLLCSRKSWNIVQNTTKQADCKVSTF